MFARPEHEQDEQDQVQVDERDQHRMKLIDAVPFDCGSLICERRTRDSDRGRG
jgi:hypothetical protein